MITDLCIGWTGIHFHPESKGMGGIQRLAALQPGPSRKAWMETCHDLGVTLCMSSQREVLTKHRFPQHYGAPACICYLERDSGRH